MTNIYVCTDCGLMCVGGIGLTHLCIIGRKLNNKILEQKFCKALKRVRIAERRAREEGMG